MAINDWKQGDDTDALAGTTSASSIDNNIVAYIQDPLSTLLCNYQNGVTVDYTSASSVTINLGEICCLDTAGTILRMRKMTSSQTCNTLDTGSLSGANTYYVYATADTSDTAFSGIITLSSTFPAGVTYAKKIAQFKTTGGSIDQDSVEQLTSSVRKSFGSWQTKTDGTTYLAATDGFVVSYVYISSSSTGFILYSDSSATPTTVRMRSTANYDHFNYTAQVCCPIKAGDYWKLDVSTGSSDALYWLPLQ